MLSRFRVLTDEQWASLESLLPSIAGRRGHPFEDNRRVVEGIIYRFRHRRCAGDGTWDRALQLLLYGADAIGAIDWDVSVDTTIARAHQHATNTQWRHPPQRRRPIQLIRHYLPRHRSTPHLHHLDPQREDTL